MTDNRGINDFDLLLLFDANDVEPMNADDEPEPELDDNTEVLDMIQREHESLIANLK